MSSPEIDQKKQTQMVNPPTQVLQSKMTKVEVMHSIRVIRNGAEEMYNAGQIALLTEDEAKEFCDKVFKIGHKSRFGYCDPQETEVRRARRVAS